MLSFMFILLQDCEAEQLVILEQPESRTPVVESKVSPNAEYLTWSDIRQLPLTYSGVSDSQTCLGMTTSIADLKDSLSKAESAVAYLETESALGHVQKILSNIVCADEILPREILVRSNYIAGVAYGYDKDFEAARRYWRTALMFEPELNWDDNIEPSGKPIFEDEKQNLQSQATSRLVFSPPNTKVALDGQTISNGESIAPGSHFVQHVAKDNQGHLISIETGSDVHFVSFIDYPEALSDVMKSQASRDDLLKALLIAQDKSDIRIITQSDYWYLPMGTTVWKSQALDSLSSKTTLSKPEKDQINKALLVSGLASIGLGTASLIVANGQRQTFEGYTANTPQDVIQDTWSKQRLYWFSGIGFMTLGGGLAISGTF